MIGAGLLTTALICAIRLPRANLSIFHNILNMLQHFFTVVATQMSEQSYEFM
jgi:hypothetical protein